MTNSNAPFSMKFTYHDGKLLTITNKSFRQAIKTVLNPEFIFEIPVKLTVPSTGLTFYFDRQHFVSFNKDEIDILELRDLTECQGLYRNKAKLLTDHGEEIDPGSLWKMKNNVLSLINDDEYITCKYVDYLFDEV